MSTFFWNLFVLHFLKGYSLNFGIITLNLCLFTVRFGETHPDPVVETASLSSIDPTDIWYELSLPKTTIDSGGLSSLQLEAIIYTAQQHEKFLPDGSRVGFLIGTQLY